MTVAHRILFNFSASPVGGGLKRLREYARWFDANGGAWFMIHQRCRSLAEEFPGNRFFIIGQSRLARMVDDFASVRRTLADLGSVPACYFAYGVPLYGRVGRVNWFHLSNVLPLAWRGIPLPVQSRLRFRLLGRQIVRGLPHADVISAESQASLALFGAECRDRLFESVNGSDDELREARRAAGAPRRPVAVAVGTYPHKDLPESCAVFDVLKRTDAALQLAVYGDESLISPSIRARPDVAVRGNRPRAEVIDELLQARYYLSTTRIENSYNAASEGVFLAEESYVSDIGPHRELLGRLPHERVALTASQRPLIHVRRSDLSTAHLKTWTGVITDMNARIDRALQACAERASDLATPAS
jgi:hypothetical protein